MNLTVQCTLCICFDNSHLSEAAELRKRELPRQLIDLILESAAGMTIFWLFGSVARIFNFIVEKKLSLNWPCLSAAH